MRWASVPFCLGVAVGAVACGFGGSSGDLPDGGAPDGPPLQPGETDLVIDSVAEWNEAATLDGAFVSTAGGAGGAIEPIARLGGRLFVELDEDNGPYDGTWASHPMPNQLVRTSFQVPSFSQQLAGMPTTFVYWFSGEIRLDSGAQKLAVATSPDPAVAFVDVLSRDGKTELVHCASTMTSCDVTATAAGWYPIRMGWKRPNGSGGNFDLRYTNGGGAPTNVDPTRLRAPLVTAQHTGSRLEAFTAQRAFDPVTTAVMIDADKPMDLDWGGSTFGMGASATYRNTAQIRIPEDGSYDFVVDANGGSSHRFWLDGEWLSTASLFDYLDDGVDPPAATFTKQLTAGWHDLVAEGYDTRGNNGNVAITYGKTGSARAPLPVAATRPAIGGLQVATQLNQTSVQLQSNTPVTRALTINGLATNPPDAIAIDVAVTLTPRVWNGLQIKVIPPGGTAIPLVFDDSLLPDNQSGKVTGSLSKAALGAAAKAQGTWTVEVTHAANGQHSNQNVIAEVEVHVTYAGANDVAGAKLVDASATYVRMFKLDQACELRNVLFDAIKPTGSDVRVEVAICSDEAGTSCQAALSVEQLAAQKPMAQYVKVTATLTSNGYVVPILSKLALRYLGNP